MKRLSSVARTTEVDDASDRLLNLYAQETALKSEAFLKPLFAELQTLSDQITDAIKKDQALSELEDADGVRDEAVRKLFKIADGYAAMPMDEFRLPAERLQNILTKFGLAITRAGYAEESSYIEAMLTDIAAVPADVSALPGVQQAVEAIRTAQTDFATKRIAYDKTRSIEKGGDTATTLKKSILDLINNRLLPYLHAMKLADATKYGGFADAAAQVITTVNTVVNQRGSKAKAAGERPEK